MTPAALSAYQQQRTTAEVAAQSVIANNASEETTLVARALLDAYGLIDALLGETAAMRDFMATVQASVRREQMRLALLDANLEAARKGEA